MKYKIVRRYSPDAENVAKIVCCVLTEEAENMERNGKGIDMKSLLAYADANKAWDRIKEEALAYACSLSLVRYLIRKHPIQNRLRLWFGMKLIGESVETVCK
jgi:hypothetical protein